MIKLPFRTLLTLVTLSAVAGMLAACGVATEKTWSSEAVSTDGNWTATAMTEGTSGPGNNYLGTSVYLKRTGARGRGYKILGYQQDGSGREAPLTVVWSDRSTLRVTLNKPHQVDLQVCKYGGITIVVEPAP
jgi:hypothetical protein